MTNREVIERLKELGFEDRTEPRYWTYPVAYGGTMTQRCQDDLLDFVKDYGENTITIAVENDRWCFNGINDEDRISTNEAVWTNHSFDNEGLIRCTGAIVSIEEDGDSILFTVRIRRKNSYEVYKKEIRVGFDYYEEEDEDDDYDEDDEE